MFGLYRVSSRHKLYFVVLYINLNIQYLYNISEWLPRK